MCYSLFDKEIINNDDFIFDCKVQSRFTFHFHVTNKKISSVRTEVYILLALDQPPCDTELITSLIATECHLISKFCTLLLQTKTEE